MNVSTAQPSLLQNKKRIHSIDIVRGVIMIIMALDHVRDFWSQAPFKPDDLSQTSVAYFFTRWITHFCAPVFIFLSGISIRMYQNNKTKKQVAFFLLTRGVWLLFLEVFVLNFLWQYAYDFILIEVIWTIGWSMICLAGLIWLPRKVILAIAILIIVGHNLVPNVAPVTTQNAFLAWLHNTPFVIQFPGIPFALVAYSLFPWVGVMALGYCVGEWYQYDTSKRIKLLSASGIVFIVLFVLLRFLNIYGDPVPWTTQPRGNAFTILSFLNVTKKPPSFLYLLMTLGPALIFLSIAEKFKRFTGEFARTFGQVPFFFFILHIALISGSSLLWVKLHYGVSVNLAFTSVKKFPVGYQPSLLRAYIVWIVVILVMFLPCKWYGNYKRKSKSWWVSYV